MTAFVIEPSCVGMNAGPVGAYGYHPSNNARFPKATSYFQSDDLLHVCDPPPSHRRASETRPVRPGVASTCAGGPSVSTAMPKSSRGSVCSSWQATRPARKEVVVDLGDVPYLIADDAVNPHADWESNAAARHSPPGVNTNGVASHGSVASGANSSRPAN